MQKLSGIEMEFHLLNDQGDVVPQAETVLSDIRNTGYFLPEQSKNMIEVIAPPQPTVTQTAKRFKEELVTLQHILNDHNLHLLPSTTIGKDAIVEAKQDQSDRIQAKYHILGEEKKTLEYHIAGTHIHIDQLHTDELVHKQYLLMQAFDPLFAHMSATPFFQGQNTKHDYRLHIYRNIVFEKYPQFGTLQDYPASYQDIRKRQQDNYSEWMGLVHSIGKTDSISNEYNSSWGPIRLTRKTIESRAADSTLFSKTVALLEMYNALSDFIEDTDPKIVITDTIEPLSLKKDVLAIPSLKTLQALQYYGIEYGPDHPVLNAYLQNARTLIDSYAKNEYLEAFNQPTLSQEISAYAKKYGLKKDGEILGLDEAREIRLYASYRFRDDLDGGRI